MRNRKNDIIELNIKIPTECIKDYFMENNKSKVGRPTDELKDKTIKCRVSSAYKEKLDAFIDDLNNEKINNISDLIRISLNDYMKRNERKGKLIFALSGVKSIKDIFKNELIVELQDGTIATIKLEIELGECIKHVENNKGITDKFRNDKGEIYQLYLDKDGEFVIIRRG